jgi:2-polyprenyl-3-methyl-5-hydroxy-6-metoxy-1,4-benzoquinol methylase
MTISNCRVCGDVFFKEPILQFKNMPKSAQNFPDENSLLEDKGVDLDIYQCTGCGLVQLNCEPVSYYKEVIRASAFSEDMREFRTKQFDEFVNRFSLKHKKVIEIGCGKGEYLSLMQQSGAHAYGTEYSLESSLRCIGEGLSVENTYIEDKNCQLSNAPFDAFFIMNFFEHLPDPNTVLKGVYNNLSDDGIGLIEVPNFNMILKKNMFSEFIADHLFYFTKETLTSTLERSGFEIIECKEVWYDYIISATIRKRKKTNVSRFYEHQMKIKKEINDYICSFGSSPVAVWGAGHQSLAVLSLCEISNKICYVVDDALFKQDKYTPSTHIPIVSADEIKTKPPAAIIVMAASYSDEVSKKVLKYFDQKIKLSILRDDGLEIIR